MIGISTQRCQLLEHDGEVMHAAFVIPTMSCPVLDTNYIVVCQYQLDAQCQQSNEDAIHYLVGVGVKIKGCFPRDSKCRLPVGMMLHTIVCLLCSPPSGTLPGGHSPIGGRSRCSFGLNTPSSSSPGCWGPPHLGIGLTLQPTRQFEAVLHVHAVDQLSKWLQE